MLPELKAVPYMALVRQYAFSQGLAFFTWADQQKAIILYEQQAKTLN